MQDIIITHRIPNKEEIAALHRKAFGKDPLNKPGGTVAYLDRKNKILNFAYLNDQLVGFCFGEDAKSISQEKEARIHRPEITLNIPLIASDPEFQGKGIGSRLLATTIQDGKEQGLIYGCGFFKAGHSYKLAKALFGDPFELRYDNFRASDSTYYFLRGRLKK